MNQKQLDDITAWFERFTAGFAAAAPADQRNYDLKVEHTRRVADIIGRLTASLGMSPDERALASAIAVCHDVGRFPQYRDYGTFNDATSLNHAALAVRTLKGEGIPSALDYGEGVLLLQAIALHNVLSLPGTCRGAARRFALLIRDADKLDIWRVLIEHFTSPQEERASAVTWELPDTGGCSATAINEVACGRVLDRRLLETSDDFKLLQLSWVFDLNFRESFRIADERGYIDRLAALLPDTPGCAAAAESVRRHLQVCMASQDL